MHSALGASCSNLGTSLGIAEPAIAAPSSVQHRHGLLAVVCHIGRHAAQHELHQPAAHVAAHHHLGSRRVRRSGTGWLLWCTLPPSVGIQRCCNEYPAVSTAAGRSKLTHCRRPQLLSFTDQGSNTGPTGTQSSQPRQLAHRRRPQLLSSLADGVSHSRHTLIGCLHQHLHLVGDPCHLQQHGGNGWEHGR